MKKIIVLCGLIVCFLFAHSQGENNNWAFGNSCGISFSTGVPAFFANSMYAREGAATISDPFGNLIFYTSGNMVWDRTHNPMPHGNILGNYGGSGTQAALILKSLSNPNQYYVFTLDPQELALVGYNTKLRYSIVDMTLNEGLGDVHPTIRDIELDDKMEERMTAVETHDCGYWIVSHKRHSKDYVSFKLDETGLSGPFYSAGVLQGNFNGSDVGELKISPDKTKIAINMTNLDPVNPYDINYFGLEVGEFDVTTGLISNAIAVDSNKGTFGYGLSFSPDNSKLYANHISYDFNLHQYDMSLFPDAEAMRDNKIEVYHLDDPDAVYDLQYGMRIGPDDKIYMTSDSGFIRCIENPNVLGIGCDFNKYAFPMPAEYSFGPGSPFYSFSLGNPTAAVSYKDTLPGMRKQVTVCFKDSAFLQVENNLLNYTWENGYSGNRRVVYEDGTYYCISSRLCTVRYDTFDVRFVKGSFQLGADTTLCPGDSIVLSVSGDGFMWQDGSTLPVYTVNTDGRYIVAIDKDGCQFSDTINVSVYRDVARITPDDTVVCQGQKVLLQGISNPAGDFLWSTGSSSNSIEVDATGYYMAQIENICGQFTDTAYVVVQNCDCRPALPNAFTPNGDGLNDIFIPKLDCFAGAYQLGIFNRFGERVFVSFNQNAGWDGTLRNGQVDVGVYFYYLQYQTPNGELKQYKGDLTLLR